ncbi:MAG TPA: TylF/MycF/NovP-related O-methyltransferase, partial [Terriglobales bacterium]|nr:TylF/MycF/NovP-related O-methyltransferase [Terriglobales bacterium]
DRRAVLSFLRASYPVPLSLWQRLSLVVRFVHITNQVRAYHSQAQMLAVADAVFRRVAARPVTLLECGCGKGGSTAKLSLIAQLAGGRLIACDSFKGMPPNDERHTDLKGRPMVFRAGAFRGRLREVQRAVESYGAPQAVDYRKGWFADTLPVLQEPIDVAFLDVDLLESTRVCLRYLVPRLRPGGVIFTQDGHITAIAQLLGDARFWQEEIGIPPPRIAGLGRKKFLRIEPDPGGTSGPDYTACI